MPAPDRPQPALFNGDKLNEQELRRRTGLGPEDLNTGVMKYKLKTGEVVTGNLRRVFKECPHVPQAIEEAYAEGGIDGVKRAYKGMELMHGLKEGTLQISQETLALHENKKKIDERPEVRDTTQAAQIEATPQEVTQPVPQVVSMPVDTIHTSVIKPIKADIPMEKSVTPPSVEQIKPFGQKVIDVPKERIMIPIIPHVLESMVSQVPIVAQESREKTVTKTPAVEINATSSKHDIAVSEPVRRETTNQEVKRAQPSPAAKDQAPVTKPIESMTKEEAVASVISSIDTLLSKDLPDVSENEKSTVSMVKKEGMITLGVVMKAENNTPHGENPAEPPLKPISTADELIQMLDILNLLSRENLFTPKTTPDIQNILAPESMDSIHTNLPRGERRDQHEKAPQMSLLVSEDVLHFLKNGKALFEKLKKKYDETAVLQENNDAMQEPVQMHNPVKVLSGENELLIEMEMLKKLIELVKVRKQMRENTYDAANVKILEELGLHGIDYQNYENDDPLLFIKETMIRSLASTDDIQLSQYSQAEVPIFPSSVLTA